MGYRIDSRNLVAAFIGSNPILAIYYGREKLWPDDVQAPVSRRTCYHGVGWRDDLPWLDDDIWE